MISFRLNEIPNGLSEEHLNVTAEDLDVEETGIRVVRVHLRFHKQDEHLRVECSMIAEAAFTCDRSLDTYQTELNSSYEVVFQNNVTDEREDVSGALKRLDPAQNVIDITKELRDSVLLSVPIKKLHPRYYKDGEITEFEASFGDTESEKENDPRWDALKKLKQNIQKN